MEPLRRYESPPGEPRLPERRVVIAADPMPSQPPLAQSSPIRQTPPNTVTYAQIIRPTPKYQNVSIPPQQGDNLDFRLQTPSPSHVNHLQVIKNGSQASSGRSSISSGYIDVTMNQTSIMRAPTGAIPKNFDSSRPKSPETDF